MGTIHVTARDGEERTLTATVGDSVMEIIRQSGFGDIRAICGGNAACATCHVYVDAPFLPMLTEIDEDEEEMLSCADNRQENSRLSCQIIFSENLDGLRTTIAPE